MNDERASQIKSIQTLGSVAIIASPVSLVFGGVLLSLAALICAIVGRSKLNALKASDSTDASVMRILARQNTVGIVVSAAAVVINAIAFAFTFTTLMQAVQSGDASQLNALFGMDQLQDASSAADSAAQNASVWDK